MKEKVVRPEGLELSTFWFVGDFRLHANTRGTTRANRISAKGEEF
jgi:hypothetical protein